MTEKIIELKKAVYKFDDGTAGLNGTDLTIRRGERAAVIGRNGSGKSTLFLALNGILKLSGGEYLFSGTKVKYSGKGRENIKRKVGIVFQNSDNQLFMPSVLTDVCFGIMNMGFNTAEAEKRAEECLDALGILSLKDKPIHYLSGGEKKMVSLAGVLAMEPEVILLDEPYSSLDAIGIAALNDILYKLNRDGITIVMSDHDLDRVYSFADTVHIMEKGQVKRCGECGEVFSDTEYINDVFGTSPYIPQIYRMLGGKDKPPRTRDGLVNFINRTFKKA